MCIRDSANLSRAHLDLGNVSRAVEIARHSLAVHSELGRPMRRASAHFALGLALARAGRHAEALSQFADAQDIFTEHRQRLWVGNTHFRMAEVHLAADRPAQAAQHAEQALALGCVGGDRMRGNVVALLGRSLFLLGQKDRARACWRDALGLYEQCGAAEADAVRDLLEGATAA